MPKHVSNCMAWCSAQGGVAFCNADAVSVASYQPGFAAYYFLLVRNSSQQSCSVSDAASWPLLVPEATRRPFSLSRTSSTSTTCSDMKCWVVDKKVLQLVEYLAAACEEVAHTRSSTVGKVSGLAYHMQWVARATTVALGTITPESCSETIHDRQDCASTIKRHLFGCQCISVQLNMSGYKHWSETGHTQ